MPTAQELERIISRLPDVLGVRVAMEGGEVSELHVLAGPRRHPMQIVRDIEAVVATQFQLRLDRRVVSVAQLRDDAIGKPPRPVLESVQVKLRGEAAEAEVELSVNGARFVGRATGPSARMQRLRTVAAATLEAVQASLGGTVRFSLDELGVVRIGSDDAVVVTVLVHTGSGDELTVGASYVWRDDGESAARAALSAVNRRYGLLQRQAPTA